MIVSWRVVVYDPTSWRRVARPPTTIIIVDRTSQAGRAVTVGDRLTRAGCREATLDRDLADIRRCRAFLPSPSSNIVLVGQTTTSLQGTALPPLLLLLLLPRWSIAVVWSAQVVSARHSEGPPFSAISGCDNVRLGIQLGLGLGLRSVVWLWQYQELFHATTMNDGFQNGGPEPHT